MRRCRRCGGSVLPGLDPDGAACLLCGETPGAKPSQAELLDQARRCAYIRSDQWSRSFDCCVNCGKTDKPHIGNGLCSLCYDKPKPGRPVKAVG